MVNTFRNRPHNSGTTRSGRGCRPFPGAWLAATVAALVLPWVAQRLAPGGLLPIRLAVVGAALGLMLIGAIRSREGAAPASGRECFRRRRPPEGCQASPRRGRPRPAVTVALMTAALLSYAFLPGNGPESDARLPLEALGVPNLLWVTASGVFRHPDAVRFGLDWVLLAYFGLLMEWRLGSGRVLATVVLGSVLASLISLNLMLPGGDGGAATVDGIRHPPVGVSGAVAGLMGLFSLQGRSGRGPRIRSFQPLWIGGLLLIGTYMLQDFGAGATAVAGIAGTVAYWSHLGAFGGGVAVAAVAAVEDADHESAGCAPVAAGRSERSQGDESCASAASIRRHGRHFLLHLRHQAINIHKFFPVKGICTASPDRLACYKSDCDWH